MTSVVTCHGGTDGVDKAGSSYLDTELSFPLDQILYHMTAGRGIEL
jgi:hypothetical protein